MRIVEGMIIKIILMLNSLKTQLCEAIYHLVKVVVVLEQFKREEEEAEAEAEAEHLLQKNYNYSGIKTILRITIKSLHLTFEMLSIPANFLPLQPQMLRSFARAQIKMVILDIIY